MESSNITDIILVGTLFAGYSILWKIKRKTQIQQTSIDPEVIYSDTRPTQKYFSNLSKIMSVSLLAILLSHLTFNLEGFFYIQSRVLLDPWFDILGMVIGFCGLIIYYIAQRTMGTSWRVGIDKNEPTELITIGVFSLIRNPTYSGLFLMCIGSFLILPSTLLLTWNLIFLVMIEFQVRNEEEFLIKSHGEKYRTYCFNTKRYIPYVY